MCPITLLQKGLEERPCFRNVLWPNKWYSQEEESTWADGFHWGPEGRWGGGGRGKGTGTEPASAPAWSH